MRPVRVSSTVSGCQHSKNQSPFAPNSLFIRAIICRNATASSIDSCVSAAPPGPSIIAAATSFDAMIA